MSASRSTTEPFQSQGHARSEPSVIERLAQDMVNRWRQGERPLTESYLEQFPHLQQSPGAALELIAEELALREEYGEPVSLPDLDQRFPLWQAQIRALVECQRTLGPRTPLFPAPGDVLGDFHLVSELGRGSHARVYLASQPSLGSRLVVLKLGPAAGHEHLSLARLQHTHIVPLYSVHEFPEQGLRGLCLPYFGGTTLGDVLSRLRAPRPTLTGSDVLAALKQEGAQGAVAPPTGAGWVSLQKASFQDVVCWIGVCLADALQYAHDRGLLHLDLKPSNVLLAADGVPMLLDFHLARAPLQAGDPPPTGLGGTPGYVAPEQLAAMQAVREGVEIPRTVDGRADVYALGVVLREALAHAPTAEGTAASSVGLADVLARCTAPNPEDRYPAASALATDLRRHLASQPLRGVPNRSLTERWRKWRRRRPHALTLLLILAALGAVFVGLAIHTDRLADRAAAAHRDGLLQLNQGRYAEATEAFRSGEVLAEGLPFHRELRARLRESRVMAERGQAAVELHAICEQLRPLYAAEFPTSAQSQFVERRCRELWEQRESFATKLTGQLTPDLERRWRADLLDVAIIASRLGEQLASPATILDVHRSGLVTLEQAESLLGGSGVLYLERARHARALGLHLLADQATRNAQSHPPTTAWDHLVVGRYYLTVGSLTRAAGALDRCLECDPQSLWGHYYKGVCALQSGRPTEAVAAFSACKALAPNVAWCHHNRGLAYTEVGQLELALADFDRALVLDPSLAASFLGRATIHQRRGRYTDAFSDLRRAADAGIPRAEIEYRKALVSLAMGDRETAIATLRNCLRLDPRHVLAQTTFARLAATR